MALRPAGIGRTELVNLPCVWCGACGTLFFTLINWEADEIDPSAGTSQAELWYCEACGDFFKIPLQQNDF